MFDFLATELSSFLHCLWLFDMVKVNPMAPAVGQAAVPLADQFYGLFVFLYLYFTCVQWIHNNNKTGYRTCQE